MNTRKANGLFLVIILCYLSTVAVFSALRGIVGISLTVNLIISEAIIWIPAVIFLVMTRTNPIRLCRVRRLRISTVLLVAVFSFLAMPVGTLLNILSMFFVENAVSGMSGAMLQMPFWLAFLMIGVYSPLCEELVFRGVLFQSYKKENSVFGAVLISSVLFGLMHMNFNQAVYAIGLGIVMALLAEAAGSLWAPFIFHMIVNGKNVVSLFLMKLLPNGEADRAIAAAAAYGTKELLQALAMEIFLAALLLPAAACLLVYIARREGRLDKLKAVWTGRKERRGRVITLPLVLGVAACLIFMTADVLLGW